MSVGKGSTQSAIKDKDTGITAGVETIVGKNRLLVDSNISSVNVPLGKDPLPDCYFTIIAAGAIGDTVRVQIAGTSFDTTTPDADLPAVDVTYTLVAADVGDEKQLAENIEQALNTDTNFQNAFLEAEAIDDSRFVLHITSTEFSLNGENLERPNAGDIQVTTTGTTSVQLDTSNQVLVSRAKEVSLSRDPNNPHRLGVQNISGSVQLTAGDLEDLLIERTANVATTTPATYTINANPVGGKDKFIEVLKLYGEDGNIKVGDANFLGNNAPLTNGIRVDIYLEGVIAFSFPLLKSTNDILARFSSEPSNSEIIGQSGGDYFISMFSFVSRNLTIKLESGTNDRIEIVTQDNLNQVNSLYFIAEGFEK